MRKLAALLLALALISASFALADIPDISGLTHDELLELNRSVQLALFADASEGVQVPAGVYTVGEDIPEGTYRIEFRSDTLLAITFMALNEEPFMCYTQVFGYNGPKEIGKLQLYAGTVVTIENGNLWFLPYTGLFN